MSFNIKLLKTGWGGGGSTCDYLGRIWKRSWLVLILYRTFPKGNQDGSIKKNDLEIKKKSQVRGEKHPTAQLAFHS